MNDSAVRASSELVAMLSEVLAVRSAALAGVPGLDASLEECWGGPSSRLATYGSLRPGERHDDELSMIAGSWTEGVVHGEVSEWRGYPRLVWSEDAGPVAVALFESVELEAHWERLDRFEGADYVRSFVPVVTASGIVVASCYLSRG